MALKGVSKTLGVGPCMRANSLKIRWPALSWPVRKPEHDPRQHSRRLNFNARSADNASRANDLTPKKWT